MGAPDALALLRAHAQSRRQTLDAVAARALNRELQLSLGADACPIGSVHQMTGW
jgi:hypothetical protein